MNTSIKACNCVQPVKTSGGADYQDLLYGKGKRVHNVVNKKTGDNVELRCTICGSKK